MFEVIIKEITTVRKVIRGEHTVVDRRPYTDAELGSSTAWQHSEAGKKGETKPIYGYAPDREMDVPVEREILKQCVADLDLAAVIRAVNKL